jgi:hypothetical protein
MIFKISSKIADHAQGRDVNRFKNGAYTLVFEYFLQGEGKKGFPVPAGNKALGC